MTTTLRSRRLALFALFFAPGITLSSWVSRTPDIRDLLGVSIGEMGLVLFGLSVGSMAGILSSGPLVARFGARPVVLTGTIAVAIGATAIGVGSALALPVVVALGLGMFGFGMGSAEVAMNVDGADVERGLGRSTLPALHGFFSLGTVVGASAGVALTALRIPVLLHLLVVAAVVVAILVAAIRHVTYIGKVDRRDAATAVTAGPPVWRDPALLLIGLIILGLALAEGTANDWLPLIMVDGHGFEAAFGSAVYALFAASMTVGRFVGGWFVDRFGRALVLGVSAAISAVGISLIAFVDSQPIAVAAAVLWGLGAALGFPVALSAAGASGPDEAARVSLAATIGYVAFLVGPPALGFLGEHFGLRLALIAVIALVIVAVVASPAARTRARVPLD